MQCGTRTVQTDVNEGLVETDEGSVLSVLRLWVWEALKITNFEPSSKKYNEIRVFSGINSKNPDGHPYRFTTTQSTAVMCWSWESDYNAEMSNSVTRVFRVFRIMSPNATDWPVGTSPSSRSRSASCSGSSGAALEFLSAALFIRVSLYRLVRVYVIRIEHSDKTRARQCLLSNCLYKRNFKQIAGA